MKSLALIFIPLSLLAAEPTPKDPIDAVFQHANNWLQHGHLQNQDGTQGPVFVEELDIWTRTSPKAEHTLWQQDSPDTVDYDPYLVELLLSIQSLLPGDFGKDEKRVTWNSYADAADAYRHNFSEDKRSAPSITPAEEVIEPSTPAPTLSAGEIAAIIEKWNKNAETATTRDARQQALDASRPWVELAINQYWRSGFFVSGPSPAMKTGQDPWRISSRRSGSSRLALAVLRNSLLQDGYSLVILQRR